MQRQVDAGLKKNLAIQGVVIYNISELLIIKSMNYDGVVLMPREDWAVKICKALGHPIRYKIVKFLADGPHCVCELNEDVEFSQSNLSQHLKILREAGLVQSEKVGLRIFYSLHNERVVDLVEVVEDIAGDFISTFAQAK